MVCCLGLILHYFRRSPTLSKTAGPRVPGPPQKVCPAVLKLPMKCILLEGIPLVNIPYIGDGSRFNVPSNPARSRASPVTSKCEIPSVGRRDLGEANVRPLAWGRLVSNQMLENQGSRPSYMWTLTLALAPKLWHRSIDHFLGATQKKNQSVGRLWLRRRSNVSHHKVWSVPGFEREHVLTSR